jgi:hypothetical protein
MGSNGSSCRLVTFDILNTDADIEACVCLNESLMVLADHSGSVHFVDLDAGEILYSRVVCNPNVKQPTFVGINVLHFPETIELLLVVHTGRMLRLVIPSNLSIGTDLDLERLQSLIQMEMVESGINDICLVSSFMLTDNFDFYPNENLSGYLVCKSDGSLLVFTSNLEIIAQVDPDVFRSKPITSISIHANFAAILDVDSRVYLLDLYTQLIVKEYDLEGCMYCSSGST